MVSVITASIGGTSYFALNPRRLESRAQEVADQVSCRAVDTAIVGYLMNNGTEPTAIGQLTSYVRGDISEYRIVNGMAEGPGCAAIH